MTQQLRTFQSNFTGGELSPAMWSRTDVSKYQTGAKNLQNFLLRPEGGIRNRNGTQFVGLIGATGVSGWLRPFSIGPGESYMLEFTPGILRFVREGAYILDSSSETTVTLTEYGDEIEFGAIAHGFAEGDFLYLDQADDVLPGLSGRMVVVDTVATDSFTVRDPAGGPFTLPPEADLPGTARVAKDYRIATPYTYNEYREIDIAQDHAVGYVLSRNHPVHRLERIAPDNWVFVEEDFQPGIAPPASVSAVAQNGTGNVTYNYVVSAISAATGEESLPSIEASVDNDLSLVGHINRITWSAVPGAQRYIIYKEENGVFGYIGGTFALQFDDQNITPDLSDTPQQGRNPFDGEGNYPGVGTFFEQRLVLASTYNNPGGVWASQSASPRNFGVSSPVKESDAITFRVRANGATQIEALVPTEKLLLMTRGGEWEVNGGDRDLYLTPTNIVLRQRAYRGSTSVRPVLVGDFVVHVQRGGDAVRDLNLTRDVASTELSLLAKHIFKGRRVVSMAYQQKPDSVVWVVLNDGNVAALTYLLEHDIWGWSVMDFGGFVEDVAVVSEGPNGVDDAVYFVIRRTSAAGVQACLERLSTTEAAAVFVPPLNGAPPRSVLDAYHVDSGVFYQSDDEPITVVGGLRHLEGRTLVALADGNVVPGLTVVNGSVTLPEPARVIAVGLRFVSRLRTLDLDIGPVQGLGSILGRYKTLTEVTLRVADTRGCFVGHESEADAVEFRQRAYELWGEAIELYTGDVTITPRPDWTTGGGIVVEQRDPLPVSINGLLATWEFGE
jgi:hypothetical protein